MITIQSDPESTPDPQSFYRKTVTVQQIDGTSTGRRCLLDCQHIAYVFGQGELIAKWMECEVCRKEGAPNE